jgi:hypothetical protein
MIGPVRGSCVVVCAVAALAVLTSATAPAAVTEEGQGAGSSGAPIVIEHDPVGCVVAAQHPSFEARFDPVGDVRSARLRFRPAGGRDWYSVAMEPRGGTFTGILPKPKADLAGLDYYIEVIGEGAESSRTAEYSPVVEAGVAACQNRKVAGMLGQAVVRILAPEGAPLVPPGFSSAGVVAAGNATAAGTGAANTGEASGASGAAAKGLSSKALILGGVAAAGVAGVAVAAGGGGGDDGGSSPTSYTNSASGSSGSSGSSGGSGGSGNTPSLGGSWTGAMSFTAAGCGYVDALVLSLTQSGSTLSGTGTIERVEHCEGGLLPPVPMSMSGTVSGSSVAMELRLTDSPDVHVPFHGTATANQMSGTCENGADTCTWELHR